MANQEFDAQLRESENPYEMIVLAAREAERINAARLAPSDKKPTSMAIERVARGETKREDAGSAQASSDASGDQEPTQAA
jgi:DNA-directed RNA polymerase subunit K/omega